MKVMWLFPVNRRCGISIYSHDYINELNNKCEVITEDLSAIVNGKEPFLKGADKVDLVHVQYETSFFLKGRKDIYFKILSKLKVPVIVTLHEVYDEFPQIYPRSKIRGHGSVLAVKQIIYDIKHPVQTAFRKHCNKGFGADLILLHHRFHKEILLKKGIKPERVEILELPVKRSASKVNWKAGKQLILGSTGFINPGYDYDLLFSALEKTEIDWKFIWIGGLRDDEHAEILQDLRARIVDRKWQNRFIITGWVSEENQNEMLEKIDIYLSLFRYKSTSATFSRAVGALKPVIATEIPMTKELNAYFNNGKSGPVMTVDNTPESVALAIRKILDDSRYRTELLEAVELYSETLNITNMADRLITIYRRLCR